LTALIGEYEDLGGNFDWSFLWGENNS
jgi:hypothetical protein